MLAAVLVGLAALWLVLEPLIRPRSAPPIAYEPVDLEETPKGVALSALKEIEFDRETGKLSDSDYDILKARYTAEALEALRDEESVGPNDIEALIAAKVRSLRSASAATSLDTPSCDACGPRPETDALFCSSCGRRLASSATCAGCGAAIVAGSRFCEGCGRPVAA